MPQAKTKSAEGRRFWGYPKAIEAPSTPYKKSDDANPVFSGIIFVILARLLTKVEFFQMLLWYNAGFGSLRKLDLRKYSERWDPMVIPLPSDSNSPGYTARLDPESFTSLPANTPGRYRSVLDYHSLYLSGELTPLAVIESLLPLIRRDVDNPSNHSVAFIDCHSDVVLEAAKASTLRYKEGKPLSILDGVPTAIKDEADAAGYRTTFGRKKNDAIFPIAKESIWPVQKWEEAGAIILGKTNLHELGADTTNNNPNWGTPRNPYNDQYYTGGSSGGSAYAIAAGIVPFALGVDGGGSIRIPASFCGIYGLKPSHTRLNDVGSTVTVTGPLAANMSDLEAVYRVMASPDPSDPNCSLFAPPGTPSNSSKVLGIYKDWFNRADPSVLKLCNQVIDHFRDKLGYSVVDIELPYVPEGQLAHTITILSDMANGAHEHPSSDFWLSGFTPATKVYLSVGGQSSARDYSLAQKFRQMLMQHLAHLYKKHPGLIIVTPTSPIAGWPIAKEIDLKYGVTDGNMSIRNMEYVWLANFCGNPAISCPVGYVDPAKGNGKVPVGIMAMGEWGSEDALLQWGREAESWLNEEYAGGRQRPANWVDVVTEIKTKM